MDPNEEKIRQYMKKNIKVDIDKQPTQQEKEEFVRRKLFTEQTHQHSFQKRSIFDRMRTQVLNGYGYFKTRKFRMFMKETFPFLAFFSFSTYIIYKMELQFDKMNQSVFKIKTLKEQEIERENDVIQLFFNCILIKLIIYYPQIYILDSIFNLTIQKYISKALRGDKFSNLENQITDVPDKRNKYKFEEAEDEVTADFDTRDDFLEGLRKDYNQGMQIAEDYREQVFEYARRENKKIGFGIGLTEEDEDMDTKRTEILPNSNEQKNKVKTIRRNNKKPKFDDLEDGYEGFGPSN